MIIRQEIASVLIAVTVAVAAAPNAHASGVGTQLAFTSSSFEAKDVSARVDRIGAIVGTLSAIGKDIS